MRDALIGTVCFLLGAAFTFALHAVQPTPVYAATISQASPQVAKEVTLPPPGDTYHVLGQLPGLKNFVVRYDKQLIRGGEFYAQEGASALKALQVQTVISITPGDMERLICDKYGFKLVEIPYEKSALPGAFIDRVVTALRDCAKPAYLHCHGGTHRGGAVGMMYRIACNGMDAQQAIAEYERLGGDPHNNDKELADSIVAHLTPGSTP